MDIPIQNVVITNSPSTKTIISKNGKLLNNYNTLAVCSMYNMFINYTVRFIRSIAFEKIKIKHCSFLSLTVYHDCQTNRAEQRKK